VDARLTAFSGSEIRKGVSQTGTPDTLLSFGGHAPGWMRIGAGLSSAKLALLSRLGAASRATNTQGLFLLGSHDSIMQYSIARS